MDAKTRAALAGIGIQGWIPPRMIKPSPSQLRGMGIKVPSSQPERKCLRKDCGNTTKHNGGYCCADCCRQDREERRNTSAGA